MKKRWGNNPGAQATSNVVPNLHSCPEFTKLRGASTTSSDRTGRPLPHAPTSRSPLFLASRSPLFPTSRTPIAPRRGVHQPILDHVRPRRLHFGEGSLEYPRPRLFHPHVLRADEGPEKAVQAHERQHRIHRSAGRVGGDAQKIPLVGCPFHKTPSVRHLRVPVRTAVVLVHAAEESIELGLGVGHGRGGGGGGAGASASLGGTISFSSRVDLARADVGQTTLDAGDPPLP